MNEEGVIVLTGEQRFRYHKSLIKNDVKMSYEKANMILKKQEEEADLETADENQIQSKQVSTALHQLKKLMSNRRILREKIDG